MTRNHTDTPSLFSFGGGRQSTAALVLAATGQIEPFDVWVFADVGDNSENPATIKYLHEHTVPFAERHGPDLRIVRWERRGGYLTLLDYLHEFDRDIPIPVSFGCLRMESRRTPQNGKPFCRISCNAVDIEFGNETPDRSGFHKEDQ